jgi:glycosyltransferase involved in cell wall biosynthesis
MEIVVSHPTGNSNVRAVISSLDKRRFLREFCTTVSVQSTDWPLALMPERLRRQALRRSYTLQHAAIVRHPSRELTRQVAHALGMAKLTAHETGWASVDAVCADLDRRVAQRIKRQDASITGVYCYEDSALMTFRAAREQGLIRCYDLPIAYFETAQRLLRDEAERWPEWEPTLVGTRDSAAKLERKAEEMDLADVVMTPSRFVLESLPAHIRREKQCHVAEFGSPVLASPVIRSEEPERSGPLRLLFAGSMTQRKGLADLFAAMRLLNRSDVELIVLGSPVMPLDFYKGQYGGFTYEPPRPHSEVLRLMQTCDVFVLPSIVEGRALVQQEAMACGLPLIVTANAGGEDLIEPGETGFLTPIRSPEAIAEKIGWFADNRNALPRMREQAMRKAAEYTWERYGDRVAEIIGAAVERPRHESIA